MQYSISNDDLVSCECWVLQKSLYERFAEKHPQLPASSSHFHGFQVANYRNSFKVLSLSNHTDWCSSLIEREWLVHKLHDIGGSWLTKSISADVQNLILHWTSTQQQQLRSRTCWYRHYVYDRKRCSFQAVLMGQALDCCIYITEHCRCLVLVQGATAVGCSAFALQFVITFLLFEPAQPCHHAVNTLVC